MTTINNHPAPGSGIASILSLVNKINEIINDPVAAPRTFLVEGIAQNDTYVFFVAEPQGDDIFTYGSKFVLTEGDGLTPLPDATGNLTVNETWAAFSEAMTEAAGPTYSLSFSNLDAIPRTVFVVRDADNEIVAVDDGSGNMDGRNGWTVNSGGSELTYSSGISGLTFTADPGDLTVFYLTDDTSGTTPDRLDDDSINQFNAAPILLKLSGSVQAGNTETTVSYGYESTFGELPIDYLLNAVRSVESTSAPITAVIKELKLGADAGNWDDDRNAVPYYTLKETAVNLDENKASYEKEHIHDPGNAPDGRHLTIRQLFNFADDSILVRLIGDLSSSGIVQEFYDDDTNYMVYRMGFNVDLTTAPAPNLNKVPSPTTLTANRLVHTGATQMGAMIIECVISIPDAWTSLRVYMADSTGGASTTFELGALLTMDNGENPEFRLPGQIIPSPPVSSTDARSVTIGTLYYYALTNFLRDLGELNEETYQGDITMDAAAFIKSGYLRFHIEGGTLGVSQGSLVFYDDILWTFDAITGAGGVPRAGVYFENGSHETVSGIGSTDDVTATIITSPIPGRVILPGSVYVWRTGAYASDNAKGTLDNQRSVSCDELFVDYVTGLLRVKWSGGSGNTNVRYLYTDPNATAGHIHGLSDPLTGDQPVTLKSLRSRESAYIKRGRVERVREPMTESGVSQFYHDFVIRPDLSSVRLFDHTMRLVGILEESGGVWTVTPQNGATIFSQPSPINDTGGANAKGQIGDSGTKLTFTDGYGGDPGEVPTAMVVDFYTYATNIEEVTEPGYELIFGTGSYDYDNETYLRTRNFPRNNIIDPDGYDVVNRAYLDSRVANAQIAPLDDQTGRRIKINGIGGATPFTWSGGNVSRLSAGARVVAVDIIIDHTYGLGGAATWASTSADSYNYYGANGRYAPYVPNHQPVGGDVYNSAGFPNDPKYFIAGVVAPTGRTQRLWYYSGARNDTVIQPYNQIKGRPRAYNASDGEYRELVVGSDSPQNTPIFAAQAEAGVRWHSVLLRELQGKLGSGGEANTKLADPDNTFHLYPFRTEVYWGDDAFDSYYPQAADRLYRRFYAPSFVDTMWKYDFGGVDYYGQTMRPSLLMRVFWMNEVMFHLELPHYNGGATGSESYDVAASGSYSGATQIGPLNVNLPTDYSITPGTFSVELHTVAGTFTRSPSSLASPSIGLFSEDAIVQNGSINYKTGELLLTLKSPLVAGTPRAVVSYDTQAAALDGFFPSRISHRMAFMLAPAQPPDIEPTKSGYMICRIAFLLGKTVTPYTDSELSEFPVPLSPAVSTGETSELGAYSRYLERMPSVPGADGENGVYFGQAMQMIDPFDYGDPINIQHTGLAHGGQTPEEGHAVYGIMPSEDKWTSSYLVLHGHYTYLSPYPIYSGSLHWYPESWSVGIKTAYPTGDSPSRSNQNIDLSRRHGPDDRYGSNRGAGDQTATQ